MKNIVKRYLNLSNLSTFQNSFEQHFLSHPDYPSLFAVTDSLSFLGIENVAAKVETDDFGNLPDIFLTFLSGQLVLVNKSKGLIRVEYEQEGSRQFKKNDFLQLWEKTILVVEEGDQQTKFKKEGVYLPLVSLSLVMFFVLKNVLLDQMTLQASALFTLVLSGFVLGIFIVREKIMGARPFSKFCSLGQSASCEEVIRSPYAKLMGKLEISDLPIVYFSSALVALLLDVQYGQLIVFSSGMALPAVIYSVWLQKFRIKKWCPLCLMTGLTLLLISVMTFKFSADAHLTTVLDFVLIMILVALVWFIIRDSLLKEQSYRVENAGLMKLKRNPGVFFNLLEPVSNGKPIDHFKAVRIGERDAHHELTLLLSPGCLHCHTAYNRAMELISRFPDKIGLRILYNVNPFNKDNEYATIALTIMEWNKNNPEMAQQAIKDWHFKRVTLDQWMKKWQIDLDDSTATALELQYQWCMSNRFNYAPVKLFNGKLLPDEYDIADLAYFINDVPPSGTLEENIILLQR